jgi:adenylate cyclase
LARVTFYSLEGIPLASTLVTDRAGLQLPSGTVASVLATENRRMTVREINLASYPYAELLSTFTVRREQSLGIIAVALPTERLAAASDPARNWLIAIFGAATVLILAMGALLSAQIVRPIQTLVKATQQVAGGDLKAAVEVQSADEVGQLACAFNAMTSGLRERQRERDLFGRTVSPEIRDAILADKVGLGGETLYATVLFSDIAGFTAMSEKLPPEGVVAFLNEYLTAMERPIRENGGNINKYVGDAIVAIFGAPVSCHDDALRAVRAALGMRVELAALNIRRQARGEAPLAHGIGISTGEVVAGAIGSPDRSEYTVIGDTVNVASRLQGLTRGLPSCDTLVTEGVVQAMGNAGGLKFVEVGDIQVKGRAETVRIYELKA